MNFELKVVMKRRNVLTAAAGLPLLLLHTKAFAQNDWGKSLGYPISIRDSLVRNPIYRVGNYSGGFEQFFPHHIISANPKNPSKFYNKYIDIPYNFNGSRKHIQDYLKSYPITGMIITRSDDIFFESYQFSRTESMRMTGWSMAKSITSLLLGICLDLKLIDNYDDLAEKYVPELKGTLHGQVSLRNLSNMSSGAKISHPADNDIIFPAAFTSKNSNITATVASWNERREESGKVFNYNELCALTIGMVIRKVTGKTMSAFAEMTLWQPMGAEADATWTTDPTGAEFNCIGFAACLRDWARVGRLVAQRGAMNGKQIISESWINECTHWDQKDQHTQYGLVNPKWGYKAHMWHFNKDGTRLSFSGFHGQRLIVDMPTQTVLVQTAVTQNGDFLNELTQIFDTVTRM